MDIVIFQQILKSEPLEKIVQEIIYDGVPFCFQEDIELYNSFRKEICDFFDIHPQNFTVVGSAKTGFSLSPHKFGKEFDIASDIDVVLVSEKLFQKIWFDLIKYRDTSLYKLSSYNQNKFNKMQRILFWGHIRLNYLSSDFSFAKTWWEFFNKLSVDNRFGKRKINGLIFKSWRHVSIYYEHGIKKLMDGEL